MTRTPRFMLLESTWPRHEDHDRSGGPLALRVEVDELTDPDLDIRWPDRRRSSRLWARVVAKPATAKALALLPAGARLSVRPGRLVIRVPRSESDFTVIGRVVRCGQILADALADATRGTREARGHAHRRQVALNNI